MADKEKKGSQPPDADKIVAEFDRNPLERVRITVRMYKGKRYVDIRNFYRNDEGTFLPTKKGVSLSEEFLPELRSGVKAAAAYLEEANGAKDEDEAQKADKKKGKKHSKKGK